MTIKFTDYLLNFALFALIFSLVSTFVYQSRQTRKTVVNRNYPCYHLVCLLEDAPETALKGQFYELATPLMTPLACIVPENWHKFYQENLGKTGINYWEWRDKPESNNVCKELSLLLQLPVPNNYAREVLECLADGKNPFWDFNVNGHQQGKIARQHFQQQNQINIQFKHWHQQAKKQIGKTNLQAIYQVCYRTSWQRVEAIINHQKKLQHFVNKSAQWWQILGVHPKANPSQVEQAYKTLIRTWHPDINQHPNATEVSAQINLAYEQYQTLNQQYVTEVNDNIWGKIRNWLF